MTRLLSETWRGTIALVVGLLVALASTVVAESLGALKGDGNDVDLIMLGMAGFLGTYVVLTLLAFARLPWAEVEAWARRTPPVHWARQAVTSSRPGPGRARQPGSVSSRSSSPSSGCRVWARAGCSPPSSRPSSSPR